MEIKGTTNKNIEIRTVGTGMFEIYIDGQKILNIDTLKNINIKEGKKLILNG